MAFGKYMTNKQISDIRDEAFREGVTYGFAKAEQEFNNNTERIIDGHKIDLIRIMNYVFTESLMRIGWGAERISRQLHIKADIEDEINSDKLTIPDIQEHLRQRKLGIVADELENLDAEWDKQLEESRKRKEESRLRREYDGYAL